MPSAVMDMFVSVLRDYTKRAVRKGHARKASEASSTVWES